MARTKHLQKHLLFKQMQKTCPLSENVLFKVLIFYFKCFYFYSSGVTNFILPISCQLMSMCVYVEVVLILYADHLPSFKSL